MSLFLDTLTDLLASLRKLLANSRQKTKMKDWVVTLQTAVGGTIHRATTQDGEGYLPMRLDHDYLHRGIDEMQLFYAPGAGDKRRGYRRFAEALFRALDDLRTATDHATREQYAGALLKGLRQEVSSQGFKGLLRMEAVVRLSAADPTEDIIWLEPGTSGTSGRIVACFHCGAAGCHGRYSAEGAVCDRCFGC